MYKANSSLLPLLMTCLLALPAAAETRNPPIEIEAESTRHDGNRGTLELRDNVRIASGETVVHADVGFAYQRADRSFERVELEGAPVTWQGLDDAGESVHGQALQVVLQLPGNRVDMSGQVRFERAGLVVEADSAQALQSDGRYDRIELEGNPARWNMDNDQGERVEGQSTRIVYDLIDRQVTMIGEARVNEPRGSFSGQRLRYDLESQATEGEGGIQMIIESGAREGPPEGDRQD